jgi:hypothetical protein
MARRRTTQTTDDQQTTDTAAIAGTAGTTAANAEALAPAPPALAPPARRGRRPRTDTEGDTEGNTGEAAATIAEPGAASDVDAATAAPAGQQPRQQRRRRRRTIDTAAEARLLIAAVLRQRGAAGASQDELQQVVSWGRSTRAESQELQRGTGQTGPKGRSHSAPSEEAIARAQRSELNTLLLERVLLGTLGLDVHGGQLVFRRQELDGRITDG